ncbi:MAG: tRNA lysidine(34) synthetase TilS [Phycisphaeraceae bacterium]|nr:MAG: tRNA lysidine(34) synthetase TilS [Phycisphaeraceae bacterium]
MVACSGGADSVALALGLRGIGAPVTLAHIVHDLRPAAETEMDRASVEALAERLGIPFVCDSIRVQGGNKESAARRGRYRALSELARSAGIGFVATAHHADDQFESIVMALLRGSGVRGLAGVAPRRRLGEGVRLIRPMLGLRREDAERLCRESGVGWREDQTNLDTTRLRAALRHGPLKELEALRPGAATRAARSGAMLRDAAGLVQDRVCEVFGDGFEWERAALRRERAIVVGAGLRRAALKLTGGVGADRLGAKRVDPAVRAVRDEGTEPREFHWPGGVVVRVHANAVQMSAGADKNGPPRSDGPL